MGGVLKPYYLLFTVFLQNTFRPHPTFFGPAWSLSIEEWFYLLFPLGLAFAIRWLKLRGEKLFAFVVLLFIGSCLLLRIVVAFTANPEWLIGFRTIMPLRLDSIAFGVGFALLKYYHPGFFKKYRFLFCKRCCRNINYAFCFLFRLPATIRAQGRVFPENIFL